MVWGGGAGCCFARRCRIPVTIFFCRQQAHTWQSCCFPASALSQLVGEPLAMCRPPPASPGTPKRCPPIDGAAGRGQGKGAGWWCCKAGGDSLLSWAEGGRGHVALGEEGTEPISVTSVVLGSPLFPPREGSQHQGLGCVLGRAALCWDEEEDGAGSLLDHVHIPSGLAAFVGGL